MKINIKQTLVKSLGLALAAGLIVTSGWMPTAASAQGMMGGMGMMHGADVKLVQEQGGTGPCASQPSLSLMRRTATPATIP